MGDAKVEEESEEEDPESTTTTSKMSMADYFKSKTAGPRRSPRLAAASPPMGGLGLGASTGLGFSGLGFGAAEDSTKDAAVSAENTKKRKKPDVDRPMWLQEQIDNAKIELKHESKDGDG